MKNIKTLNTLLIMGALALPVSFLTGCDDGPDDDLRDAADEVGDAAEKTADKVKDATKDAADEVKDATN